MPSRWHRPTRKNHRTPPVHLPYADRAALQRLLDQARRQRQSATRKEQPK